MVELRPAMARTSSRHPRSNGGSDDCRHHLDFSGGFPRVVMRLELIRMRVREVLADVAHVDPPCMAGVVMVVHPGGDQALPGYLEMRAHENGAVRAYVPGNREYPQLPEPG